MLLNELVEVLAEHFNILSDDITSILKTNNIRISQRLLLENRIPVMNTQEQDKINVTKKEEPYKCANNITSNNVEGKKNKIKIENPIEPNETILPNINTNIESKPVRGRGRPRKNTIMKEEEEEVCVEVETVKVGSELYYKTKENVIVSKSLEVVGLWMDGKIVRRV